MLHIIVCIKQVFDPAELKVDPNTRRLVTEGVPRKISDFDKNALEEAIRIKEKYGAQTMAITLGPPEAIRALREAIAMGIDDACLLTDPAFENSDTLATSRILAWAIRKIGEFDLIFCAEASVDGYSAQVGPRIAEWLGIPQLTYVRRIVSLEGGKITVERDLEEGYETVEARMPVLIIVTKEINEPRFPTLMRIMAASKKEVKTWGMKDLGLSEHEVGDLGSAIRILKAEAPLIGRKNILFEGEVQEVVDQLVKSLAKEGVLRI